MLLSSALLKELSDLRQPLPGKAEFIGLRDTPMARISHKRRRFPAVVIQHARWLYFRFTLSQRVNRRGVTAPIAAHYIDFVKSRGVLDRRLFTR
jgi:hypothetical protein